MGKKWRTNLNKLEDNSKFYLYPQGVSGEKGQKGDVGHPGIDVFQTVKVNTYIVEIRLLTLCYLIDYGWWIA